MPSMMSTMVLPLVLALLAGVATAFQPGINAKFAQAAGHPLHGGVVNFAVGCAVMLMLWAVMSRAAGMPTPEAAKLAGGPWWMWLGGALGAFFVCTAVYLIPKVGAANYLAAMVAGQLITSLLIDHFGLMGLREVAITPMRVAGVLLILGGMAAVKFG
ncbi:MAG: DMT family transporter [Planctomycetaceae bacterium]|jgi:transporter family-2 protein|nr:DMT family transporter [Phycisphaerales bacterium]MCE2652674.1 DMT family transporter [Planctomycetaceae bacterium]